MEPDTLPVAASTSTAWPVSDRLIGALARRSFVDLAACLDPEVRLRAVLPRAVLDLQSAGAVTAKLEEWFGGSDVFEVVATSAGVVGTRQYVRWRIRMWPPDRPDRSRVVEQHAFIRGLDRVESLDLLCSGFQVEHDAGPGGAR